MDKRQRPTSQHRQDHIHTTQTQIVQNTALRIATGCTHDTNTQHLHDETNVLPIHQHLQLHASKIRQKAQHPTHPLYKLTLHPHTPRQKISSSELSLPRETRSTLAQLRTNKHAGGVGRQQQQLYTLYLNNLLSHLHDDKIIKIDYRKYYHSKRKPKLIFFGGGNIPRRTQHTFHIRAVKSSPPPFLRLFDGRRLRSELSKDVNYFMQSLN